jgi:short-subunit dehydrogenase
VVVANAGFGVADRIDRLTLDDFRRQFETNVFGVLRTVYATLADLKQTHGRLAIIGSVNGFIAPPSSGAYALSKFSARALAYLLHAELAPQGVSVTHVAPGFVTTEIFQVNKQGKYNPEAKIDVPAWLRMPAATAARHIVRAMRKRKREVVITLHGKLAVWLANHTPWLVYGVLKLAVQRGWVRRRR